MNKELPPFKNGEHNSESTSTIDRVITPLMNFLSQRLVGVVGVELYEELTLAVGAQDECFDLGSSALTM